MNASLRLMPKLRASRLWCAGLALCVLLAPSSCTRDKARWTPESVAPPASLESALAEETPAEPGAQDPATEAKRLTQPGPDDAAGEKPADAAPSETVSVTRDGAILMALERSRSLAVDRFGPDISSVDIAQARAAFDPSLLATVSYGWDKSAVQTSSSSTSTRTSTQGAGTTGGTTGGSDGLAADLTTLLQDVSTLQQQVATLRQKDVYIDTSRQVDTSTRISEFLPTGTEFFLSGGVSRTHSSLADETEYAGNWTIGVNQSLLRGFGTGVNLATFRQSRNAAAKSEHVLRNAVLDLVQEVENAYWDLVLARETLTIRESSVQLAEEQLRLNEALISVGKLAESARVSAEAALASSKADLVDAKANVKARNITLWRLLNPEPYPRQGPDFGLGDSPKVEYIAPDAETSVALARLYSPALAQARLDLANRELEVVRTRNGLLPNLDLSATYGRDSRAYPLRTVRKNLEDGDYDNFQIGLSFEMSLLNRAERASHRRARFQQEQAEAAVSNLEQVVESDVRQTAVEVERQWERILATQQEVKSREEELRIEQDQFRVGRSTNLDVLQVQQNLIQAKVDEVTARVAYIEALTALYHAEGTLLDRRGVALDADWEKQT